MNHKETRHLNWLLARSRRNASINSYYSREDYTFSLLPTFPVGPIASLFLPFSYIMWISRRLCHVYFKLPFHKPSPAQFPSLYFLSYQTYSRICPKEHDKITREDIISYSFPCAVTFFIRKWLLFHKKTSAWAPVCCAVKKFPYGYDIQKYVVNTSTVLDPNAKYMFNFTPYHDHNEIHPIRTPLSDLITKYFVPPSYLRLLAAEHLPLSEISTIHGLLIDQLHTHRCTVTLGCLPIVDLQIQFQSQETTYKPVDWTPVFGGGLPT